MQFHSILLFVFSSAGASFAFYMIGQLLHAWMKANLVVHSAKSTLNTYGAYIAHYAPDLMVRLFASVLLFLLWNGGVDLGFIPARVQFSSTWVACAVAGFMGLGVDSLLDKLAAKWTWLQGQIPPEPGAEKAAAATAAGETPRS